MISSHSDTSREVREKLERAEGAREKEKGKKRRAEAIKPKGAGAPKWTDLSLVSYLKTIYMSKPKYFLYARKSTEDDDKQVMSIDAQLFELREFARKENLEILEEFQESKSAKTPGRPIFNEMMAKIEEIGNCGILAWHPDRLARNSIDGGRIIYAVDQKNIVSLRFPTFWFEPTHPRIQKKKHDFPFTGTFSCGECASMFTAQWATGKCGGKYRYYRCTKKKGTCSQGYLREEVLAEQIKEQLQTISLCDKYADWMLQRVEKWEQEENNLSQSGDKNLAVKIKESESRLDKLVSAYLDDDVPKEIYLKKKDKLMRESLTLKQEKKDFNHKGNNWVEPLREWILDTKQADFLSSSDNFKEIAFFVKKVGTNPRVLDKSAHFGALAPFGFVLSARRFLPFSSSGTPSARRSSALSECEVSTCDPTGNRTPIYAVKGRCPSR